MNARFDPVVCNIAFILLLLILITQINIFHENAFVFIEN